MSPTVIIIVVVVVLVVAVVGFFVMRSRGQDEEPVYHFACPKCKRRLRYKARQVGHKGQCPQCATQLTFPPLSKAER